MHNGHSGGFAYKSGLRSFEQSPPIYALKRLFELALDRSLSSSQTSDRHTEGRAGHVVQANLVAELNGDGVAAVLAADAVVQLLAGRLGLGDSHLHQLTNAVLIQLSEGIVLVDLRIVVSGQELLSFSSFVLPVRKLISFSIDFLRYHINLI